MKNKFTHPYFPISTLPPWYKISPLWPIPQDWEVLELGEVADFKNWYAFKSEEYSDNGIYTIITIANVQDGSFVVNNAKRIDSTPSDIQWHQILETWDLLISMTWNVGRVCLVDKKNCLLNQRVWKVIFDESIFQRYVFFVLNDKKFLDAMIKKAQWWAQWNIWKDDILWYKLPLPPLPEQTAIVSILSNCDETITQTQQLITQLQLRHQALCQQLLTGKRRLQGFDEKWETVRLGDIANEVSKKNKDDQEMIVLSCTKYKWLVPSLEYFGKKIYSDDLTTYKIVPKHCFAYATNHIEEWSLGYQTNYEKALISPMYTIFQTNDTINDDFLYKVLKSHQYIHEYQKRMEWSIDRRWGLRRDEFAKIKVPLPSPAEQTAIAFILNDSQAQIDLAKSKLTKLKQNKQGLMQQLLTGKTRVRSDMIF